VSAAPTAPLVLVVDDEPNLRDALAEVLAGRGYRVVQAGDGTDAVRVLARETPDLIFCDWRMPTMDGEEVLRLVRREVRLRDVPFIVMTAYGTSHAAIEAVRQGAYDFVTKPFDLHEILLTAERALDHLRLHREVGRLARARARERGASNGAAGPDAAGDGAAPDDAPGALVGLTPAMVDVFKLVGRVAPSEATVLVRGESGTGKELVARAIHDYGPRRRGPFVAVNCAALPESLLESELFGHERGAFTGAVARRAGRFELAAGGTLFLDEIGELAPALQAKLLRVLQARTFERVGGAETLKADVRLVAATNRDLEAAVRDHSFREDLYYRLGVVTITLPPLRARRADVIPLAEHFLRQARGVGAGGPGPDAHPGLTPAAVAALESYDFPGNVRELQNVIERAAVLSAGRAITPALLGLPNDDRAGAAAGSADGAPDPAADPGALLDMPYHAAVTALERALITRALAEAGGNKAEAARRLGVQRRLLYAKLAEFGLL